MPGRIGTTSLAVLAAAMLAPFAAAQTEGLTRPTVPIAVSPAGNDAADGSIAHPFRPLTRAHVAVRHAHAKGAVVVRLAHGQIGRASWRARVCAYVCISLGPC